MEDKNEEFTNEKSLRSTILEEKKDNEEVAEASPEPQSLSKKNFINNISSCTYSCSFIFRSSFICFSKR